MRKVTSIAAALGASLVAAAGARAEDHCARGLELARTNPVAAFVHLEACVTGDGATRDHRAALRELKRQLDGGDYALITIATTPADVAVAVKPLDIVVTNRVYLPPGTYTLEVAADGYMPLSRPLEVTGRYRETVELTLLQARTGPQTHTVDLTGEPGRTEIVRGKDPEHENLIPDKYRRGQPGDLGGEPAAGRSRWPYAALAIGLVAVGAGVGLHLDDRTSIAAGLYVAGGAGVALGATGLALRW